MNLRRRNRYRIVVRPCNHPRRPQSSIERDWMWSVFARGGSNIANGWSDTADEARAAALAAAEADACYKGYVKNNTIDETVDL